MSRLRGILPLGAVLGALLGMTMANEAKAANNYRLVVVITDETTHATNTFTINQTGPGSGDNSGGSNSIVASGAFDTSASGVTISPGAYTSYTETSSSTQLGVNATATVNSGSTDTYSVTITASLNSIFTPMGNQATLSQSESGSYGYTGTVASNTQGFQSWYDPTNTLNNPAGTTPGAQSFTLGATGLGTSSGASSTPGSIGISPYTQPYALTETVTLVIKGTGAQNNAYDQVTGTATITTASVPEPASLVMLLTGMPVPLVVLSLLRRRKAKAKN